MLTYSKFSNPVTICLEIAVAYVLFRRRLYHELPWFTAYIVYVTAFTATVYGITFTRSIPAMFYSYWTGTMINQFFAFMVIIEVFRNSVRGHDSVRKIGIMMLVGIAVITLVVVLVMAPYGSEFDKSAYLLRVMQILQRSIRVIQIGLLVGIFLFLSYLGMSWRHHNFGIALGYGLYATVNLISIVVQGYLHPLHAGHIVDIIAFIDGFAYKLTLVLWLTYLWRSDRGSTNPPLPPSGGDDLDHWDDALKPLK